MNRNRIEETGPVPQSGDGRDTFVRDDNPGQAGMG